MKSTQEELIIKLSKTKILLLIIGSFAFVALSFWSGKYDGLFIKAVSTTGILLFGLCGIYGIIKIFDNKPGLIIDKKGIRDNSSAVSGHLIRWEDITGFEVGEIKKTRFLLIFVNNPQQFLDNANPFKRFIMKMNLKMYGTPVSISSNALQCNFDELLKMLENEIKKLSVKEMNKDPGIN